MNHANARRRVEDHQRGIWSVSRSLSESPLRNIQRTLGILAEPIELPQFPMHAMRATNAIFASDLSWYGEVDSESMQASVVFDCPRTNSGLMVDVWARHMLEEPILSYWKWFQPGFVVTLSDFGTHARVRELGFYQDCLRPMGLEHHLLVPFMRSSGRVMSIGYARENRDFSEDDRVTLMLLWSQLAMCRRYCELCTIGRDRESVVHHDLSVTQVEVMVIGRDGRIRSSSSQAAEFIRHHVGEFPRGSARLPRNLETPILRSIPASGLRAPLDFHELQVFTVYEGDQILLYLRRRQRRTNEELAHAIRTTPRRAEIGRLLCGGMTPEAIAEELAISPGTVRRHIQDLYDDLGVSRLVEAIDEMRRRVADYLRDRGGA